MWTTAETWGRTWRTQVWKFWIWLGGRRKVRRWSDDTLRLSFSTTSRKPCEVGCPSWQSEVPDTPWCSKPIDAFHNMKTVTWRKRVAGNGCHVDLLVILQRSTDEDRGSVEVDWQEARARCKSQDETQANLRGCWSETLKVVNSFALLEPSSHDAGLVLLVDVVCILELDHPLAGDELQLWRCQQKLQRSASSTSGDRWGSV